MPKISVVETGTPTPIGSSITTKYVKHDGVEVTEVPAGERFDIYAGGIASNPGAGDWEVLITCHSSDGLIAVYDTTNVSGSPANTTIMKLDDHPSGFDLPVMPNYDITLYFRLWGNQKRGQPVPPTDEW